MIDMGMRCDDNKVDPKEMRDALIRNRNSFQSKRGDSKSNQSKSTKFVTQIIDDEEKNGHKLQRYSFGFRYFYHEYYRNNITEREIIPGTQGMSEHGNTDIALNYRFCDWFIPAKYASLKEEVINGDEVRLEMEEFEATYDIAKFKFDGMLRNIKGAEALWE